LPEVYYNQCSIGTATLPEVYYNHQKFFGKFKKGKHNGKNRKNRAKGQGKGGKAWLLNTTNAGVQTTLYRNAELPNTWLNCTKNPYRRPMMLKDSMKLTSTMHPRRQLHWGLKLKTPNFLGWRTTWTWTWRTQLSNTIRMMCLGT
jgi:hypothetical protein